MKICSLPLLIGAICSKWWARKKGDYRHNWLCNTLADIHKDTMLFKLEEILKWIGITAFEVWLHLVSVFVFSFLAVFKYEGLIHCTWYDAFIPLFICDGLCAYFVIIVYIRMYRDRSSVIRLLSSLLSVVLLFVFKVLLCQKLSKEKIITYSEVMVPLFALVVIVMFRSCHNNSWLANVFSWFWFNFSNYTCNKIFLLLNLWVLSYGWLLNSLW